MGQSVSSLPVVIVTVVSTLSRRRSRIHRSLGSLGDAHRRYYRHWGGV